MSSETLSRQTRRALAYARSHSAFVPRTKYIKLLQPDEQGALRPVSRLEAQERGWPVYVSRTIEPLDKVFALQGGGYGVIRFTANGATGGQLKFQRNNLKDQTNATKENVNE